MTTINRPPSNSLSETEQFDCLSLILTLLVTAWAAGVSYLRHTIIFFFSSFALATFKPGYGALAGIIQFILLAIPLIPLALFWRNWRYRQIFRAWLLAASFILATAPVQLLPVAATQAQSALLLSISIAYSLLIITLSRFFTHSSEPAPVEQKPSGKIIASLLLLALAWIVLPWLNWGTFGSLCDTILSLMAALAVSLAATLVMHNYLFEVQPLNPPAQRDFIIQGFACGVTLLLFASGTAFGFDGMQILLMIVLPSLGWVVAGFAALPWGSWRQRWLANFLLVGISAAVAMTLVDPDELPIIIGSLMGRAVTAALLTATISLVLGLLLHFLGRSARNVKPVLALILSALAAASWLIAAIIYFGYGTPGFYGEKVFVILRDQADLSPAATITDPQQRRQYVYQTLVAFADNSQAELRQIFDRYGIQYTPFYLENAIEVDGNPFLRLWLLARPEVNRVLDSPQLRPYQEPFGLPVPSMPAPASSEWNLTMIQANRAWSELGATGKGILIGQSDSGVQWDHPELMDSYRGQNGQHDYNWYDPWYKTLEPVDTGGHGTHTLGSVLGNKTGVAPDAEWIACRNLARNLGNPALYLSCMQFMLAPYPLNGDPFKNGDATLGAQVLNNSWSCPDIEGCDPNALQPAVHALRSAGIFVVVSASNDGPSCETLIAPLALYQEVYSVGAVDKNGVLALFSSRGPVTADGSNRIKPDIVAPGVDILSAIPGNQYGIMSGTSMAGPHVTGVVALMWSANPNLIGNIELTEQILNQTARPYTAALPTCRGASQKPSSAVGYGIVDAYAAVKAAKAVTP